MLLLVNLNRLDSIWKLCFNQSLLFLSQNFKRSRFLLLKLIHISVDQVYIRLPYVYIIWMYVFLMIIFPYRQFNQSFSIQNNVLKFLMWNDELLKSEIREAAEYKIIEVFTINFARFSLLAPHNLKSIKKSP